jgi:hypothetical protein
MAQMCEAFGLDPNMVARLVVDYQPGGMIVAYVEMYADRRILDVQHTLDGVKIVREERPIDG